VFAGCEIRGAVCNFPVIPRCTPSHACLESEVRSVSRASPNPAASPTQNLRDPVGAARERFASRRSGDARNPLADAAVPLLPEIFDLREFQASLSF